MSSSSAVSSSSRIYDTSITEPIYQVKLLSALRSGDPALIHPFLTEIGKDKRKFTEGDVDVSAAALHLAIRCASVETVTLLLSNRAIPVNGVHPPNSGTTPLHLAASLGRADIVNLLLEQEGIDDTLRDSQGRTCRDVSKVKEVIRAIDDSRSFLNASYQSLLRTYVHSNVSETPDHALLVLLESPRVRLVNLSYLDDATGTSLLHEAAKRKDLRLIELTVRAGADVFVRDRRGKMAYDGISKDDRVRVFLRQFTNRDTTLIDVPSSEPPALSGYLNKYTNVARGYSTRWFVLRGGILSYYRHQEDETVASRGSISMKTAVLKVAPGGEKMRFEVHSTPSRGHQHSGVQKWYLKANHHVEAHRWTQAISRSIEWYKRENVDSDGSMHIRKSVESDASRLKPVSMYRGSISQSSRFGLGTITRKKAETSATSLGDAGTGDDENGDTSPVSVHEPSYHSHDRSRDADDEANDDSSGSEFNHRTPPHESDFALQENSTTTQMELTSQLLSNLSLPPNSPAHTVELKSALKESFAVVQSMLQVYIEMSKERDAFWRAKLRRERNRQAVWEESLHTVVREGAALERELMNKSRRRGSRLFTGSFTLDSGSGTMRQRAARPLASTVLAEEAPTPPEKEQEYFPRVPTVESSTPVDVSKSEAIVTPTARRTHLPPVLLSSPSFNETEDYIDTDEEDEFFDAIESNTLPNLVISKSIASPSHDKLSLPSQDLVPYSGYKTLRERLAISNDERPSTSLWSVLKHSIGKDLTKISFPVFFNEPTSMLQRMAEDMEFTECLDAAARETDPLRRIAFVAAFAMSNYSSTIGRIAKPFNPMLGETFEYVRFDKEYRYISEQVSHHPPISACWAESPSWRYYGEVDAQNKFMGKSFEIRPTGVAHANLLLPEDWAPDYPAATGKLHEEKVVEHYSWKKVTTNVSGFILGSPTIDHYGNMTVVNHRTKDTCVLSFKPRGWRGKDAYEISGYVKDSTGRVVYEIAGRWNSQLIARPVGSGSGFLHPDVSVSTPRSASTSTEYILLWRNSPKCVAPFNLTPFAITLNDCPKDTLRPFLCPTDCRLRPDQRAFELGKYELANDLKNLQEEKQRVTRRAREEGRLAKHSPRWFTAETDGDTGERLWSPVRENKGDVEYWVERSRVYREGGVQQTKWKGVDEIFIEEPEEIKAITEA